MPLNDSVRDATIAKAPDGVQARRSAAEMTSKNNGMHVAGNPRTVFVVDDSSTVVDIVVAVLVAAGFRVKSFHSAGDALKSLQHETPSLVITDVFMPEMDGLDFIRQFRSFNRAIPVIAMSGNQRLPQQLAVAKLLGANLLLRKPFSPTELLNAVAEALQNNWPLSISSIRTGTE